MQTLADRNTSDATSAKATAIVARAIAADGRYASSLADGMAERGLARFVTKDFIDTGDVDPMVSGQVAAFLAHVDRQSILGRVRGATRLPLAAVARTIVGTLDAVETAEGATKVVAHLSFNLAQPELRKAQAGIVVSEEVVRSTDRGSLDGLRDLLVSATAAKTDELLVEVLTAGAAAPATTVAELIGALSDGAPSEPYLIGSYRDLLDLSVDELTALDRLNITLLATPAAAGKFVALDGRGLLLSDLGAEVATARHATIDLPGSPEGSTLNLWMQNLSALRAERWLRLAVRAGAAQWMSTGSPS